MPEQKMTYQERWDKLANEYAIAHGNGDLGAHRINLYYEKDARMAVAAQAEAIIWALQPYRTNGFIDNLQLEHGYIEPKTDQDGSAQTDAIDETIHSEHGLCERCKRRLATDKYSDMKVCKHCCDHLNDEFDEEYR